MLSSQAINLVPNTQTETTRPVKHSIRAAKAAMFGDIISRESKESPTGKVRAKNTPEHAVDTAPADTEPEQNSNIAPYQAVAAQTSALGQNNPQVDQALRLLETIAAILKGDQSNIPSMKDIAPLIQELQQVLQEIPPDTTAEKLLPKLEQMLTEVQARMPLNEGTADSAHKLPAIDKLNQLVGELRGYLGPLENVSEENRLLANTEATEAGRQIQLPATGHQAAAADDNDTRQNNEPNNPLPKQQTMRVDIAPHKVFFAEQTQSTGSTSFTALTPQTLFDAMVERITALPGAEPHMEIALKPDHLGKLSIDLSLGEQGLTAKIIASDEGVRNMLAAHVNRLTETLAEKGIRVENVEIIYSALADKQSGQRQSARQEQHKNSHNHAALWGVTDTQANVWDTAYNISPYMDEWGFSSVEYQA